MTEGGLRYGRLERIWDWFVWQCSCVLDAFWLSLGWLDGRAADLVWWWRRNA